MRIGIVEVNPQDVPLFQIFDQYRRTIFYFNVRFHEYFYIDEEIKEIEKFALILRRDVISIRKIKIYDRTLIRN